MGIDRKMRRAQEKSEKKERKEVEKQLKKEAKELKKEAKERGKAIADARNGSEALQSEIAVTTGVMSSLSDIENKSEEAIINNLCNFSTYGELREQLLNAKVLFKKFSKTKKHKLSKSGKKWCEQVKTKAKEWLDLADAREKRISKTNSPSAPIATAEFPYYEEMRRYQRALTAMEHDRAAGFTGRLETLALYPTNSKEYIKKWTKEIRNLAPYKSKINRLLGTRAAAEALDDNLDYAHHFLEHAVEGTFTQQDMIFYNTHGATIRELCRGTEFPGMIDMAYRGCAITPAQYRQDCAGNGDLRGMSFTDAIKKKSLFGGVSWLLQQGNMNPQTASKWANLASFAALAFWGYWTFQWAKKLGWGWFWWTTGALAWILAWGQLLSQFTTDKGLVENVKGLLWGWDNFISGFANLLSKWTGDNNPDQTGFDESNQKLLDNFYQRYDQNNQRLVLPMLFPNTNMRSLDQQITAFEQNPAQWTQFRNNALTTYRNTITGAIVDQYFPPQFNRESFVSWFSSLWVVIPAPLEHQNDQLNDVILENFIKKSLEDDGYQIVRWKSIKEMIQFLKTKKIEEVEDAFDQLEEAGFIEETDSNPNWNPNSNPNSNPNPSSDSNNGSGADNEAVGERLDQSFESWLPGYLQQRGYKIISWKTIDNIKQYFDKDDIKRQLSQAPESVSLPFELLLRANPKLIEPLTAPVNQAVDNHQATVDGNGVPLVDRYSSSDIDTLKNECLAVFEKCTGFDSRLYEPYLNAIAKVANNSSRNKWIEVEPGMWTRLLNLDNNDFRFISYGHETNICYKLQAIWGFQDDNGNLIKAPDIDQLIQTADFINLLQSRFWRYVSSIWGGSFWTSGAWNNQEIIYDGKSTWVKIPNIPYIQDNLGSFIRCLWKASPRWLMPNTKAK